MHARGEIGDSDPVMAIEDALRTFPAHEIIISTHPQGARTGWRSGSSARVEERFDLPMTHVVVDLEHEQDGYRLSEASAS